MKRVIEVVKDGRILAKYDWETKRSTTRRREVDRCVDLGHQKATLKARKAPRRPLKRQTGQKMRP